MAGSSSNFVCVDRSNTLCKSEPARSHITPSKLCSRSIQGGIGVYFAFFTLKTFPKRPIIILAGYLFCRVFGAHKLLTNVFNVKLKSEFERRNSMSKHRSISYQVRGILEKKVRFGLSRKEVKRQNDGKSPYMRYETICPKHTKTLFILLGKTV